MGDLHRDGEMAVGWCWSPARPRERLRVALLVDGVVVAATVAARLRLDLLREGVRDGYHGFSLPLPSPMPAATRIEARELASGAVFGRILLDAPADVGAWNARSDAASTLLSELHGRLGPGPVGRLRTPLAALGEALAPRSRPGLAPAPRPACVASPAFSLLFDATGRHGPAAVPACAMLLRHHAAELVVSHDGCGPHAATMAAFDGAILCAAGESAATRANHAAGRARGRTLVFLRPEGPDGLCPSALADLLRQAAVLHDPAAPTVPSSAAGACRVLAGQPVLSAARRAGLELPFSAAPGAGGTASRTGLALLVPRALFAGLDGLDPLLDDGVDLPFLDFALRAIAAGHEVLGWMEAVSPPASPGPGAAAARERFSRRWAGR